MFITVINIYSMILGGFVSLSKYGVLSSIRVVAQLFSFDIIQNLLMCLVFVIFGNYIFESYYDTHYLSKSLLPIEYVFITLLAFLAMLMENFRAPFDLAEAEAEVITGYTVEYYGFLFFAFLFSEFLSLWNGILFFNQIFFSSGVFFF
jgi:NADH-quinone oxidoreductase subunit H